MVINFVSFLAQGVLVVTNFVLFFPTGCPGEIWIELCLFQRIFRLTFEDLLCI